jgi:hypothetical protein
MKSSYNQIAGQSVERLAALSDGIFAVAMTLLLLELHAPAKELVSSEGDLRSALVALSPRILIAQSVYGFGALLCILNTYWSIAFIVFAQLYYAVAPRYGRSERSEGA